MLPPLSPEAARTKDEASIAVIERAIGARDAVNSWRATVDRASLEARASADLRNKARAGAFARSGAEPDPRSARPEVVVRVSVIDGSDRLVYADTRSRRGWTEPLAAEQVASELRKRRAANEQVSSSEPRIVRTLEAERAAVSPQGPAAKVSHGLTPYSVGKANALPGQSLGAANQRGQQDSMRPAATKPLSPARAR